MFFGNSNEISKKDKALRNIMWAVCGKIVSLLGVLVGAIIVARYLGQEQYGIMNYVVSYVAIFQVFADFGLDLIQIREESKNPSLRDKIIGTVFILKLLFAFITLLAIPITLYFFETSSEISYFIMIYAFSVVLNTTWVSRNHFTSIVWNEYMVKTEITRTLVGIIVKVALVLMHMSLIWFIMSLVLDSFLLATGYILSYTKKIDSIRKWKFDKELAVYIVKQSFPLLLSGAAIVIYNRIDQVMIGSIIDQSRLGIYSVAVRFVELLVFVPTIISQTISPMLVEIHQKDGQQYERLSQVFLNITVSGCVILAIVVSLLSYPVVYLTFGQEYIGAASVLAILSFKVIGDALSQTSGQLIIIEGIQRYASVRNIIGCVTCVVLNLIVIKHFGIRGVAYVAVITIFVSGTLADFIIPPYRRIFCKQMQSLFMGWKDIIHIRTLLQ
ncbi:MAG: flippase [Bacteroidaceae bacterium]|nr:flippase [Bacteroidaceae bacterium]